MSLRDDAAILGALAIAGYVVFRKLAGAIPSATEIVTRYTGGIVRKPDGTIDVPATVGIENPSGIPPATTEQVVAARMAIALDMPIVYLRAGGFGTPEYEQDGEIDAATTIADIAERIGAPIIRGLFGGVKVIETAQAINQTLGGGF